jgi:hypothetical protein
MGQQTIRERRESGAHSSALEHLARMHKAAAQGKRLSRSERRAMNAAAHSFEGGRNATIK